MSNELPEGVKSSTLAEGQTKRCLTQDGALSRTRTQMMRYEERLRQKQVIPVLTMGLYVVNCDKHEQPSHHVDMITSSLGDVSPQMLPHAIAAAEALLKNLKARLA